MCLGLDAEIEFFLDLNLVPRVEDGGLVGCS